MFPDLDIEARWVAHGEGRAERWAAYGEGLLAIQTAAGPSPVNTWDDDTGGRTKAIVLVGRKAASAFVFVWLPRLGIDVGWYKCDGGWSVGDGPLTPGQLSERVEESTTNHYPESRADCLRRLVGQPIYRPDVNAELDRHSWDQWYPVVAIDGTLTSDELCSVDDSCDGHTTVGVRYVPGTGVVFDRDGIDAVVYTDDLKAWETGDLRLPV